MTGEQLGLGLAPASATAAPEEAPRSRGPGALSAFLEAVADKVRAELAAAESALAHPDEQRRRRARARLGNTVRNAQLVTARSRRAIDALPEPDLALLRAQQQLVAQVDAASRAHTAGHQRGAGGSGATIRG